MPDFLLALLPSAGVFLLFVIAIRAIIFADRRERAAAPPGQVSPKADQEPSGEAHQEK